MSHHFGLISQFHGLHAISCEHLGAAGQNLIGRALGVLGHLVTGLVQGGHHLTHAVEGRFGNAGSLLDHVSLAQALSGGEVHQCALGGLAHGHVVLVGLRVGAQAHATGQQRLIGGVAVHHGHAVLGQGAGLVRADHLRAAQRFHSGQAADDGVALGHLGHADTQHDGNHSGQTFGNGGHGQRNSHHEGIDGHIKGELAFADDAHHKNQNADAQHQPSEDAAQGRQLALQGGGFVLGLSQRIGDLTHFGVHAGAGDHGAAAAVHHGGAHVDHVLTVAQRHFVTLEGIGFLLDRHAFAGEGSFLNLEAGALDDAGIRRHRVAGFQMDHVAGHQFLALEEVQLAVAHYLGGGGSHGLESLDGFLSLALLHNAHHSVQDDDRQNDEHISQAFAGVNRGHRAQGGSHQQHDDHGIGQLAQEPLHQRGLLALGQLVGAVLFKTGGGFLRAQALSGHAQLVQGFFG